MPIGPAVAELSSRDGTHVCPILTFLTISPATFPMLKQRGNRRFSSACHAFIFYPSDPVSRRRSSSIRSLQNVQISAGCGQRFGLGVTPKDPQDPKVKHTDRQTDAPYSNSIVDIRLTQCHNHLVCIAYSKLTYSGAFLNESIRLFTNCSFLRVFLANLYQAHYDIRSKIYRIRQSIVFPSVARTCFV